MEAGAQSRFQMRRYQFNLNVSKRENGRELDEKLQRDRSLEECDGGRVE